MIPESDENGVFNLMWAGVTDHIDGLEAGNVLKSLVQGPDQGFVLRGSFSRYVIGNHQQGGLAC